MKNAWIVGALVAHAGLAFAVAPGWVCFGTEPSWGLRFSDATHATLSFPDNPPVEHEGNTRRLPAMPEWMWRGRSRGGQGDIVAFIAESTCNDGMSDTKHPASVRLSLPDGRFLAGCCRVGARAAGADGIEGRRWKLAAVEGVSADLAAGRAPVTVRFESGRLEGFGGCNMFAGGYRLDGESLTIEPLAGTMMACTERPMALETAVMRVLAGTFRVEVSGQGMRLASQTGPVLAFEEATLPKLDGGRWKVSGFNNGRQAVVSPLDGTALWLQFRSGSVEGQAGCNSFRGTYTADGPQLAIGRLAATRKACARADVMQQEREFLAALRSVSTWTIDARGMLDMHRADGQRALAADGAPE